MLTVCICGGVGGCYPPTKYISKTLISFKKIKIIMLFFIFILFKIVIKYKLAGAYKKFQPKNKSN